jgi:hypothetical protein
MKKRKITRAAAPKSQPTLDELQAYLEKFYQQHQQEWQAEILEAAPEWHYLLGLHLRMVELENMQAAMGEFL